MTRAAIVIAVAAAAAALAYAQSTRPAEMMERAATAFIESLDADQRASLTFAFDDAERLNWRFVPADRLGLPLKQMNPAQREGAMALMRTGLSATGVSKAETIRQLEDVLFAMSGSATRDKELYYFSIFGEPGADRWGWRFEGHHLSQNWTIIDGRAESTTPSFFGANPAHVAEGPMAGTRALAGEADRAWAFLNALTPEQRAVAVVADDAPRDLFTGNQQRVQMLDNIGLPAADLTQAQRGLLIELIKEYASTQVGDLAEARLERVQASGIEQVRFAWMGSTDRATGGGHYYRVQGPTFLIEYDNVQNDANHQHTVWRDFDGDFGFDAIAEHYAHAPHHAGDR